MELKERARKIVMVTVDTSGTGKRRVRHSNCMAADSSESSVSYASSCVEFPPSSCLSSYRLSIMSLKLVLSYIFSKLMSTLCLVSNCHVAFFYPVSIRALKSLTTIY